MKIITTLFSLISGLSFALAQTEVCGTSVDCAQPISLFAIVNTLSSRLSPLLIGAALIVFFRWFCIIYFEKERRR